MSLHMLSTVIGKAVWPIRFKALSLPPLSISLTCQKWHVASWKNSYACLCAATKSCLEINWEAKSINSDLHKCIQLLLFANRYASWTLPGLGTGNVQKEKLCSCCNQIEKFKQDCIRNRDNCRLLVGEAQWKYVMARKLETVICSSPVPCSDRLLVCCESNTQYGVKWECVKNRIYRIYLNVFITINRKYTRYN